MPDACAIGGCVKGYVQPAHTASAVGEVAAENIFNQEAHYANPTCVYMEPEAASMGLTEEVCKAQGFSYKMGKFPLTANGKSLILNGDEDLVKIIAGRGAQGDPGDAHRRAPCDGPDWKRHPSHRHGVHGG